LAPDRSDWSAPCPSHFTPRKELPVPTDKRLGGPQSQSGQGDKEKKFLSLMGIEPWSSSSQSSQYT